MEDYIGMIRLFGGNFVIRSYDACYGQLLPISQHTALFSILGTIYGGDGRTTFAMPDLRGRVAIGEGQGPGLQGFRIGERGGSDWNFMNVTQMPSHSHVAATTIRVSTTEGSETNIEGKYLANHPNAFNEDATSGANLAGATTAIGNSGGNQGQNNMQPYLAMTYLICTQGLFPSRA